MAVVYRHIRLDKNEPFYIGIGLDEKRAFEKRKSKRSIFWTNIVKKTEYRVEILFNDLTWEQACEKEKEFISLYGRKDLGTGTLVNMTDGGEGTENRIYQITDETKEKISNTLSGRKIPTETLQKRIGIKWSEERKKERSIKFKGHNHCKKVKIIIDDILYDSMKDASIKLNIPYSTLQRKYKNNKLPYEKKSK
jgi:hypothetical protein